MIRKLGYNYSFDQSACSQCNANCCSGSSGYIFFTEREGEAISEQLGIAFEEFLERFCVAVDRRYSIKEVKVDDNYNCIFLKDGLCSIYESRPEQCRTFPFWSYYRGRVEELKRECIGVYF